MITWYYTILDGRTVRLPIDLDARPVYRGADWLHVEPWREPPPRVKTRKYYRKQIVMRCDRCYKKTMRKGVGPCKCGGWMKRNAL